MREEFARGFDIKFPCEAYVAIFNERSKFKASILQQMVGRANRSQGVQTGRVFVTSNINFKNETGMDFFKLTEKKVNADLGASLAVAIQTLWPHLNVSERISVVWAFGGSKFQQTREQFSAQKLDRHLKNRLENAIVQAQK